MNAVPKIEGVENGAHRLLASYVAEGYVFDALHYYEDAQGEPAFYRARLSHPSKPKIIRPLHLSGVRYIFGEPPAPKDGKLLYLLPQVLAADPAATVLVVEGEKCADSLAKLGLVVTTSGSADSAAGADWSPLCARRCLLWPDNDKAGTKYADTVTERVRAIGGSVEVIDVSALDLPEKGDCVDWLEAHPDTIPADVLGLTLKPAVPVSASGIELINATDLKPEPIRWLWPGWLARGKLHVLAGVPGTGKTTLAMDIAACVSAGRSLPSGYCPKQGRVLIWSGEDDPADTLIPRLLAAGADLTRIQFVGEVREKGHRYAFDPARDIPELAAALAGKDDLALLVVDPLVSAIPGDSHKNAEVRRGLAPLVELARAHDVALLGITHYSKGTQGRDPLERVTGSLAFGAQARIVFGTVRTEGDGHDVPGTLMLARCKSNIGPDGGGFTYALEQTELASHNGIVASRVVWGAAVEGTARELLTERDPDDDGVKNDAAVFLRDLLGDGTQPATAIYRHAEAAGYSKDQMKRAKCRMGVKTVKTGMNGGWVWQLPVLKGSVEGCAPNTPLSSLPSASTLLPSKGAGELEGVEGVEGSAFPGAHPSCDAEALDL